MIRFKVLGSHCLVKKNFPFLDDINRLIMLMWQFGLYRGKFLEDEYIGYEE